MLYSVKQVAVMAGVSVRTLHYYDEIGLLTPAKNQENGYRCYDEADLLRLQQILFFREMDFSLEEIGALLDDPDFDVIAALRAHQAGITAKIERLMRLLDTIEHTISFVTGESDMTDADYFGGFTAKDEADMADEAAQRWDEDIVRGSQRRWQAYGAAQQAQIKAEGNAIYRELAAALTAGHAADSATVQGVIGRWHAHLRYFYEPSVEMLRGLGELYVADDRFAANIGQQHPGLPAFMREAISVYCDRME